MSNEHPTLAQPSCYLLGGYCIYCIFLGGNLSSVQGSETKEATLISLFNTTLARVTSTNLLHLSVSLKGDVWKFGNVFLFSQHSHYFEM